ncbi:hypothetical protein FNV43_RR12429 [Rhamnella rubrinervis]|uniref:C3H1-type domain-containing protein n=1 Tax=Rhamnella rubrinervis TaxID=2594499 RepID=A0A8K0H7V3_9ROSA|nr:hypothetical protein FNV43_RR12429 [Rhamnella rubrinervis]
MAVADSNKRVRSTKHQPQRFIKKNRKPPQRAVAAAPLRQWPPKKNSKTSIVGACRYWMDGKCLHGDRCRNLHSWFRSSSGGGQTFSMSSKLEGHKKGITGIATDVSSSKIYTGDKDGIVRVWDVTGKCRKVVNIGREIGCMMMSSRNSLLFLGTVDAVKQWNTQRDVVELSLGGPIGQVYAIAMSHEEDMLFAGAQNGDITAWKLMATHNNISGIRKQFQQHSIMVGHTSVVTCIVAGSEYVFSGSMDHTIRKWSLTSLECVQTLRGHTGDVLSVLCWNEYLISCSMDKTIKVWGTTHDAGLVEEIYTRDEEDEGLALHGMFDEDGKPMLLCSCGDDSVRLYELPTFMERGRIFAKDQVRAIEAGRAGPYFFTGDWTGLVTVWKWNKENDDKDKALQQQH